LLFQKQNVLIAFKQRKGRFLRSPKRSTSASSNHFSKERWMPNLRQQKRKIEWLLMLASTKLLISCLG
jgi:hypothetical protein